MTPVEPGSSDFFPELDRAQTQEALRLIGELDEFKGRWRRLKEIQAERLESLRQVATIESAASSTRIEGAELSDAEVAEVLAGLRVDSFRSRDEEEVRGYGEVHTLIYDSYGAIPLTENHLKQLHQLLLRHVAKDEHHRGEYKKFPNDVTATHENGQAEVVFHTATPFDTPRLMASLVDETNAALADPTLHPVIVIARFVVSFLAIHPFQDGNGRLSRALTTLLLLRAGYEYVPYASLERVVEDNKFPYYAALRASQLAMREHPSRFGAWLLFFLGTLRAQKRALDAKLDVEHSMLELSATQARIVEVVRTLGSASSSDVRKRLAKLKLPERTLRYHLDLMVRRGLLAALGEKRGRRYTIGNGVGDPRLRERVATTNAIVASIFEAGGKISRRNLIALVKERGYPPQIVGILHGRRLPHLKRDPRTGESVLTARGEQVAKEHLFTQRLAKGIRLVPDTI